MANFNDYLGGEKASLDNIQKAYDKKINAYVILLKKLETRKATLLKKIKASTIGINEAMQEAEQIGIDEMNHQTIIAMLKDQYIKWFGETPPSSPECPEGLEKYLSKDTML